MSQNPTQYIREVSLPWLVMWMDTDKDYAERRIRDTFREHPCIEREIGAEVRAAWKERFGKGAQ